MFSERLNPASWAIIGFKDNTGLGRMVEDYKAVLNIRRQIVIPSERLENKPLDPTYDSVLLPEASVSQVQETLHGLQGIIFFERAGWHRNLLPIARKMGIRSLCVPMWEWFNAKDPLWEHCDLFVCPNRKCYDTLNRLGYKNIALLPTVFNLAMFPRRTVSGPGRVFIHNAGIVDQDDRKGTRDVVRAFRRIQRPDVKLIVRMQKEILLPESKADKRIHVSVSNLSDPADLYREGDVAVQPSKMEGIGFMVLEPVCCGLPVITLDYGPMNEFVRQPEMQVRKLPFARRALPSAWVKQAHLRLPSIADLTRRMEWCAANDLSTISIDNRHWAEETFNPGRLLHGWLQLMGGTMKGQDLQMTDGRQPE